MEINDGKRGKRGERGNLEAGGRCGDRERQKTLFLMTPDHRHLIVELDGVYSRRELAVLLAAFRRRLLSDEPTPVRSVGSVRGVGSVRAEKTRRVDRIVGPGFMIEMLGRSTQPDRVMTEDEE